MEPTSQSYNTVQLNQQSYIFDLSIVNNFTHMKLPVGLVQELLITDSVYSIFSSGKVVINTTNNMLDNFVKEKTDPLRERLSASSYSFNTDSRDTLIINIKPIRVESGSSDDLFPDDIWSLQYMFLIYDEEEIVTNAGAAKSKIWYLKDVREQLLSETNIQWSTTNAGLAEKYEGLNLSHVGNEFRKVTTGTAIKHLINTVLPDQQFEDDWDEGKTGTFYTSSPQSSSMDDLEFLLDSHISAQDEDNCILTIERNNKWSLRSLQHYFSYVLDKATGVPGKYLVDAFNIHSAELQFAEHREAPDDQLNLPLDGIVNFSFLNFANIDSLNELVTTLTHSYNTSEKQFNIDCEGTHILNIKKKFKELYSDKLMGRDGSPSVPVFPVNDQKVENKITNHLYSPGSLRSERVKSGINKVMSKAMAFAPCVNFETRGSSNRRTARHMLIFAKYADKDSTFGKLFVGEWFATKIHHVFLLENSEYINNITCIKTHASDKLISDDNAQQQAEYFNKWSQEHKE